jgi:hypothetical protein
LIGLNLAGVFELGSVLPSSWASARARHPMVDSAAHRRAGRGGGLALHGALHGRFAGRGRGTLPTWQALLVFAALGLGMALPYLAASAWPALAQLLPRPGVWMAALQDRDGLPDVRHRGLAGVGAGAAGGHGRRRRTAGLLVALAFVGLGAGFARAGPRRAVVLARWRAGADGGRPVLGRAHTAP